MQETLEILLAIITGTSAVGCIYFFRKSIKIKNQREILLADCVMMLRMLSEVPDHIWDNGVYDPTGTMCEGIVMQRRAELRIRANVKAINDG